jgi:hypothetical protein
MQCLVISRSQLIDLEGTPNRARRAVDAGRWQVVVPGVYATFTGPVPDLARVWAFLLHAGPGAALAGETVLWLQEVRPACPHRVQVCVPHPRRVRAPVGAVVITRRDLGAAVHPARLPPQLRVEEAVLDVAGAATTSQAVVDVVLAAVQRRVTTPARLRAVLVRRPRHRWRALVTDLLCEADGGTQSPLERRYHLGVERAHRLPRADRNQGLPTGPGGGTEYPDVRYRRFRVRVELDGGRAHPAEWSFRDRARDNRGAVADEMTLRYGWREVVADPCGVAAQVATVLTARGWSGAARRCGPGCPVTP